MASFTQRRFSIALLITGLSFTSPAFAADGFEKVRCARSIVPDLIGAGPTAREAAVRVERDGSRSD
jgi:hypothetical protein